MASSDRRSAQTASVGVMLVAITAAVISFSHVRTVAIRAGETELASWLLPVSIDGAIVAAVSVLLADSRAGRRPRVLTWLLLALGLTASLAANVASAEPTATARAVAAWPPLALALGIEVLASLARRSEPRHAGAPAGLERWPVLVESNNGDGARPNGHTAVGSPGSASRMPVGQPASGNGRSRQRQLPVSDEVAVGMIRKLDAASETGPVPRLEIQRVLGCGGSRAARLAELARRPSASAGRS